MKQKWIWLVSLFLLFCLVVGLAVGLRHMQDKQTETTLNEGGSGETEIDWFG